MRGPVIDDRGQRGSSLRGTFDTEPGPGRAPGASRGRRTRPARRPLRGRIPTLAVLGFLALASAGCGPQPELDAPTQAIGATGSTDTQRQGTGTQTGPDSVGSSAATSAPATGPDDQPADVGTGGIVEIPLPPVGPAAPDAPAPFRWYEAMHTLDCGLIADAGDPLSGVPDPLGPMFASLAQLCSAWAGAGSGVDWAAAAAAVQATEGASDCLAVAARRVLADAVAVHQADPTAQVRPGQARSGTACPVDVTSVAVEPGARAGRYVVRLRGPYLFGLQELTVADEPLDSFEADGDPAELPVVSYRGEGAGCLRPDHTVTVTAAGRGYRLTRQVSPTEELGECASAPADGSDDPSESADPAATSATGDAPSEPDDPDASAPDQRTATTGDQPRTSDG